MRVVCSSSFGLYRLQMAGLITAGRRVQRMADYGTTYRPFGRELVQSNRSILIFFEVSCVGRIPVLVLLCVNIYALTRTSCLLRHGATTAAPVLKRGAMEIINVSQGAPLENAQQAESPKPMRSVRSGFFFSETDQRWSTDQSTTLTWYVRTRNIFRR